MIELIPAIDIIGGQCVRLTKGDYAAQKTYDPHPEDVARRFYDMGVLETAEPIFVLLYVYATEPTQQGGDFTFWKWMLYIQRAIGD